MALAPNEQRWLNRNEAGDPLLDEQEMNEQELKRRVRVLTHHQKSVSRGLTWVGIEEDRAVHLGAYNSVLRDLADPSPEDWDLLRAAMLHIALSENLNLEHNRWLGEEILASFEKEAQDCLYYLTLDTRGDRPAPLFDPDEMFPNHHMTVREATYYYSRAALAVLVSHSDPGQAIELYEELDSMFTPSIRFHLPGANHSLHLDREMDRLPVLYERVGRFEDALRFRSVSFTHFGWNVQPADVAIRRLNGWLNQLSESSGIAEVERCLDTIYEWLDAASEVDDAERDHIGECPTTTRQFWAWYYGNALGGLLVARPSLRESLLDEIEAGEWETCWHIAGVLFETLPDSWTDYRQRALKFYNSSDIEYRQQGPRPGGTILPPHLSAQSDLYWAMRVGFADAHSANTAERRVSLAGLADSLERIETITSSSAQHVLRTERNTYDLLEVVKTRVPPNHEYWYDLLEEELPGLMSRLPRATADHLVDASRHRSAKEWDNCKVALCKSVESLFVRMLVPAIQALPESRGLTLALLRGKRSARKRSPEQWVGIPMSGWVQILRTATDGDINSPLRSVLPQAFPYVDLDALVRLNIKLETIAKLRGGSAHDSKTADDRKAIDAEKLWNLVVGSNGRGFLAEFHSALGFVEVGERSGDAYGSC